MQLRTLAPGLAALLATLLAAVLVGGCLYRTPPPRPRPVPPSTAGAPAAPGPAPAGPGGVGAPVAPATPGSDPARAPRTGAATGATGPAAPAAAAGAAVADAAVALPAPLTPAAIPGDTGALKQALAESAPVSYRIVGVGDTNGSDRTVLLDAILAKNGWPAADQLVLVVFTRDGHDIRFGLGNVFREHGVTVTEVLQLVRTHYQPAARGGDPAGGLAALIRAVNQRVR